MRKKLLTILIALTSALCVGGLAGCDFSVQDNSSSTDSSMESSTSSVATSSADSSVVSSEDSSIESTEESSKDSSVESTEDSSVESTEDSSVVSSEESSKDSSVESTEDSSKDSSVESTEDSSEDSSVDSSEESSEESSEDSSEEEIVLTGVSLSFTNTIVTYNGEAWTPEVVGKQQGDTVVLKITKNGKAVSEATNAGTYVFTATVTREGYLPCTTEPVTLTVNKAQGVITANTEQSIDYDGNYHYIDAELNHDEASLALKSKAVIAVGTYEFTLSAPETQNYLAPTPVKVQVSVVDTYVPKNEPASAGQITIPSDAVSTKYDGQVVTTGSFDYTNYNTNDSAFWFSVTYANNMMFQANMATKVYGSTNVSGTVVVLVERSGYKQAFYGATLQTAESGMYPFEVYVNVPYGADYKVTVINASKKAKSFTNVAFGELFFAGGQSNMGWTMDQCYDGTGTYDAASGSLNGLLYKDIIASSTNDKIRTMTVWPNHLADPLDTLANCREWSTATPESVKGMSAAAYFFVRELQEQYPDIPFGVVTSCMGGTSIYAWMKWDTYAQAIDNGWAHGRDSVADDPGESNPSSAGSRYYNAMVYPLRNHTFRGVLWYQGCGHYYNYSNLFNAMVQDWRSTFDNEKMWFIDCGLPRYGGEEDWYRCRDEHEYASTKIPYVIYSTNIDNGLYAQHADPIDAKTLNVEGIHPYAKQSVGEHAAHLMMKELFGAQGTWTGPEISSVAVSGSSIILTFNNVGEGLVLKGLSGFNIAGADGVFYDATPVLLSKNTIMLSANEVSAPRQLRYGYANYSKFVTRENCTGADQSVCVFNKKGNDYWPLDQFWFHINPTAQTVEKQEWHETKYVNVLQDGLYSAVALNDSYNVTFAYTDVAGIKNEVTLLPSFKVLKNGCDVTRQTEVTAHYADGTVEAVNLNNPIFTQAGKVTLAYMVGEDVVGYLSFVVHDFEPVTEFTMAEGPYTATTGTTFTLPAMHYVIRNEDSSVVLDMTSALKVIADYGEYEEEVSGSYEQLINSNYTLRIMLGEDEIATRAVTVTVSQTGEQISAGTWERVPGQNGNGIAGYRLYNGEVSYKFNYNISAGGNLFYPVRGKASTAPNLEYFNGLAVRLGSENGVAKLMLSYNIEDVLKTALMPDVATDFDTAHVLTYKVEDVYQGNVFQGIRVIVYMDGQQRIDYTVSSKTVLASADSMEKYLTPATIFNCTSNVSNQEIYVDGTKPYVYEMTGEMPQTLPYNATAQLPTVNVVYPNTTTVAELYVDGKAVNPATYVFSQKKMYTLSYVFNGNTLYTVQKLCASNLVFSVTPVTEAQATGTVNLPTLVATENGTDIRSQVSIKVRMGAKAVTELAGSATSFTHNVASVLTLDYYYQGSWLATTEMTVQPLGDILSDTANWTAQSVGKGYTAVKQYNARVNITYLVKSNMDGVISLPIRGDNFNNPQYWDGLALRHSVRDCFLMNPLQNGNLTYAQFDQLTPGVYHTISYQAVDVLNEDGSLKEIRVYIWLDGVLRTEKGLDYAVISASDKASFYNTYTEGAPFLKDVSAGFSIVSITFGDNMKLDYLASVGMTGATLSGTEYTVIYDTDYGFTLSGINGKVSGVTYYKRGENTALSAKPTALGSYTAMVTVSASGYQNKTFTVDFKITENKITGLGIYGQSVDFGSSAGVVLENLPDGATVTYTYGNYTNTATAPTLTEAGTTLSVTVTVSKYGYKSITQTVTLQVFAKETGNEWTSDMIAKISAPSVTTVYVGVPYTYVATTTLSGVRVEYYYKGAYYENFSVSALGTYTLELRFVKDGYKSYKTTVTVELIELKAKDVTFTATELAKVTAGTAFAMPTYTVTHNTTGENLTSYVNVSASYGAYALTDITNATTSYTPTVLGTMTLSYKVNGITVGTKEVEVGYTGNLVTGGTWNNRILDTYTVYNARVNVTFTVNEASDAMLFVPLRGTSTNSDWYGADAGALSFRLPAKKNGEMWMIYDSGNGLGAINTNYFFTSNDWLTGTEHTFSYQVKDVFNADGTLKEIRVYCWVDNKAICPGTQTGGIVHVDDNMGTLTGYFVIEATNANWQSWFTRPANILQFGLTSGVALKTSSITIG